MLDIDGIAQAEFRHPQLNHEVIVEMTSPSRSDRSQSGPGRSTTVGAALLAIGTRDSVLSRRFERRSASGDVRFSWCLLDFVLAISQITT